MNDLIEPKITLARSFFALCDFENKSKTNLRKFSKLEALTSSYVFLRSEEDFKNMFCPHFSKLRFDVFNAIASV